MEEHTEPICENNNADEAGNMHSCVLIIQPKELTWYNPMY